MVTTRQTFCNCTGQEVRLGDRVLVVVPAELYVISKVKMLDVNEPCDLPIIVRVIPARIVWGVIKTIECSQGFEFLDDQYQIGVDLQDFGFRKLPPDHLFRLADREHPARELPRHESDSV